MKIYQEFEVNIAALLYYLQEIILITSALYTSLSVRYILLCRLGV